MLSKTPWWGFLFLHVTGSEFRLTAALQTKDRETERVLTQHSIETLHTLFWGRGALNPKGFLHTIQL